MSDTLPPFPEINSAMDNLPQNSEPAVVSTTAQRLFLYANSDNSGKNAWCRISPISPAWRPSSRRC
jgi:hypothetical protein